MVASQDYFERKLMKGGTETRRNIALRKKLF